MKRTFLFTSAAVALAFGLTPALAQDHTGDTNRTMNGSPAANSRHDDNSGSHAKHAMPERGAKQGAADRDRARSRSTTGEANDENAGKTKASEQKKASPGAEREKSSNDATSPSRQKRAEDRNEKNEKPTAKSSTKAEKTEPSRNAERNDTRSPAAQKSTRSHETDRNTRSGDTDRKAQTTEPSRNESNRNTAETERGAESKTRVSASLDPQKKSQLTTAFDRVDVKPVSRVDFSVSVGTAVPRSIDLRPVPRTIVDIVPQYRDYDFFVVRDEIVIVAPRTHKIVDVIERRPSRARAETTTVHRPRLSAHQREIIRHHAVSSRRAVTTGSGSRESTRITVGETLPESVEIESFPEEVYREVPTVREYRYIERGDDVYLVDPADRRVIEEIR